MSLFEAFHGSFGVFLSPCEVVREGIRLDTPDRRGVLLPGLFRAFSPRPKLQGNGLWS
jgi:hypothetical protein